MTSSSPNDPLIPSPLAAISLKLVGAITIAAALIDFVMLLFPPNFGNRAWMIITTDGLVDRGIVPLVGIALLFTGYWIDSSIGKTSRRSSLAADPRFWTCLLSCLLGLIFLITTVVHPNNLRLQSRSDLSQLDTEAEALIAEQEGRLNAGISQQRAQLDAFLQDEELLQSAIESGELDEAQIEQIERFRSNPQEVDGFLTAQATTFQEQLQIQIDEQKKGTEAQIKSDTLKATIRVGLSSLLLAIGYTFIGWSGLKRLLAMVG